MIKLRNMLIAAIAIVGLSTSAWAGTVSVGVAGSILEVEASGTETDTLTAGGANVADTSVRKKSIAESTMTGSLFAEFTSETRWPVTIGYEYTPGTADMQNKLSRTDTELSQTGTAATTAVSSVRTASANATNFSTAYLEVPIFSYLYVRAGISHMDIDYVTTATGTNGGSYSDDISLDGTNLGVGIKGNTAGGMLWKLSYEETDYDGFTLKSTGNSVAANSNSIKGDVDTNAIRFSLAKSF
jgi:hypothetical protein